MKRICSFLLFSGLAASALHGQSLGDNFDDESRDAANWGDPIVEIGNGQLVEQNGRVEFSSTASVESLVFQPVRRNPSYNQPWQAQAVVSMDKVNFSSLNGLGYVLLNVGGGSGGDDHVGVGYAAGVLPGHSGNLVGAFSDASDASNPDGLLELNVQDLPTAIGVCVVYDPRSRMIRTYFDLDTDQTDGEWTLLKSYTIDGSTVAGAQTLDWGMGDQDTFQIGLVGGAEGTSAAVASVPAWFDNFEYVENPPIHIPTTTDNFDDDSRNAALWGTPMAFDGNGQFTERNQRLEFSASFSPGTDTFVSQQFLTFPGYDEA